MQEEPRNSSQTLDILCIGQIGAGKSFFLKQYTKDEQRDALPGPYDIYLKMVNKTLIFFHELSEQESIYLEESYDGILFFVDFVDTWNVVENILKWMELQSKYTGCNIYKIPIRVVVTKTRTIGNSQKWKKALQSELASIVAPHQIIYFQSINSIEQPLLQYFNQIDQGKAQGIKSTHQNNFRLYGISQFFKQFIINAKLTFFRCAETFDKRVRSRISFNVKINSN